MKKLITATIVALTFAGTAIADPIYVDLNPVHSAGVLTSSTPTAFLDSLNLNYDSNTSINTLTGEVHTYGGYDSIGNNMGFLSSPIYSTFSDMVSCGSSSTCGSTNTLTSDPNRFTNVLTSEYFTSGMALTYGITLNGLFDGTNLNYSSGSIDVYRYTSTPGSLNPQLLWSSNFVSSSLSAGNQTVGTLLSTSTQVTAAGQDTFFLDNGSGGMISFENYLALDPSNAIRVSAIQFVNTARLAADITAALAPGGSNNGQETVYVTANHNARITFAVPEPTSIAILGLGLLGFAGVRRRKS